MQLSATHTTNTQLFSQFLPFFNIPELKFADLRLFWFLRISREFSRNFTSRSRSRGIFTSLFTLEKSEPDFHFTFHFSDKVKEIYLSLFTSRKEWTRFLFHFSLLGKSERDLFFTFTSRTFNTHSRRTLLYPVSAETSALKSKYQHRYHLVGDQLGTMTWQLTQCVPKTEVGGMASAIWVAVG